MSLVGVYNAEWRKRKINLFSVLRSFVSQLSPGQELTKVSLPSELCHPFSMLELVAFRELQLFHILFDVTSASSDLERFLAIVKWYLGLVREETMEKKPFNPVIGETHLCWVDHTDGDSSEFIGEQVSHHPPVSAFIVRNKQRNLSITGAVTFKVGFGSNCASVTTGGEVTITTPHGDFKMTKCVPDMMVNNVIWGEKYLIWHGGVTISSADNSFVANMVFSEEGGKNVLQGEILEGEKVIFKLEGTAGHQSWITENQPEAEKKLFIDISTYQDNIIHYLPDEVQTAYNSLKLWMPVKEAIIKNDLPTADEQKKKIEADQRVRQRQRLSSGAWRDAQYFQFDAKPATEPVVEPHEEDPTVDEHQKQEEEIARGVWKFKNNFSIDQEYITAMLQEAEQIRSKTETEVPEQDAVDEPEAASETPNDSQGDGTCSVQ
eukprot:TRINITY_DN1073_c0_g1_i2.p1 TRINITY_DN1073_c0_g1~~TRINITY_DN1073_c0_g1_i2.p1  ORF type:complete len:434 (+),score=69.82 TRINITY_DN1073_c0_g1_i2:45-1346(+)